MGLNAMLTQTMTDRRTLLPPVTRPLRKFPQPESHSFMTQIDMMGVAMPFARNAEIYGETERADYLYKVLSGSIRTSKLLADGRRQIGGFYLPGDFFGLEVGDHHTFSAEAVVDSKVLVVKRSSIMGLAGRDAEIASELWSMTARELKRTQNHIMLLVKTARERVAGFLLEMANRPPAHNEIELPMSRQDIADYLGLTMETVSRTLTQLEETETIAVPKSRHILVRNRGALNRLNS
jgi:CRP/FNR family transcriptional regulator, nitrogen fixation regulation protein